MSRAQGRALAYVKQGAARASSEARSKLAAIAARHGLSEGFEHALIATLTEHARVTLNFHPDRLRRDGLTVAEGLLRDGCYRSQFETGLTNASPTAFPGGARDTWERQLFGGAYHVSTRRTTSCA